MEILISRDLTKQATICTLTVFDSEVPPGESPWDPVIEVKKKEKPLDRVKRFVALMEELDES